MTPDGWTAPPATIGALLMATALGVLISGGGPLEDAAQRRVRLVSSVACFVVGLGFFVSG
jgi:hypothetical protein